MIGETSCNRRHAKGALFEMGQTVRGNVPGRENTVARSGKGVGHIWGKSSAGPWDPRITKRLKF